MGSIAVETHPLLEACVFETTFPSTLDEMSTPEPIRKFFTLQTVAPIASDDSVRAAVRDLLRHGGFKPTGRSKPASEYLIKAASDGPLNSINLAVDTCNAVSLQSGLPISVVDLDVAVAPFRIGIAQQGTSYVFNVSGQVIDIGGLVCLWDSVGPCANAVKDSQRTKTNGATKRTLTVIWGTVQLAERTEHVWQWYRDLLTSVGGNVVRWELLTVPAE